MPTFRGTKEEIEVLAAFSGLIRASELFSDRTHAHLKGSNLSFTEFAILEALYHLGPLFQVDIGKRILRSRGSITTTVDRLEKRGAVERRRETKDRRCILVQLTEAGEGLIREVFSRHLQIMMREMSVLTSDEKRQLRSICKKLRKGHK